MFAKGCSVGALGKECPVTAASEDTVQTFLNAQQSDFVITGLRVQGENGLSKVIAWTGQQPVLPNPGL
jgi:hypothetical protein